MEAKSWNQSWLKFAVVECFVGKCHWLLYCSQAGIFSYLCRSSRHWFRRNKMSPQVNKLGKVGLTFRILKREVAGTSARFNHPLSENHKHKSDEGVFLHQPPVWPAQLLAEWTVQIMKITWNYTKRAANKQHIDGDSADRCAFESCEGCRETTKNIFFSPFVATCCIDGLAELPRQQRRPGLDGFGQHVFFPWVNFLEADWSALKVDGRQLGSKSSPRRPFVGYRLICK